MHFLMLSKEALDIHFGPGTMELWVPKVQPGWESNPCRLITNVSIRKTRKMSQIFLTTTLSVHSF